MRNGDYDLIVAPSDYPGKRYRGRYCYEHIFVAWKKYGRVPNKDEHVHHINEDKRDNRPENLEIITAHEHRAHHGAVRHFNSLVECVCTFCGKTFDRAGRSYRDCIKHGYTLYCSISCSVKHQHEKMGHQVGGSLKKVKRSAVTGENAGASPALPANLHEEVQLV